jgi:hypothetical protein
MASQKENIQLTNGGFSLLQLYNFSTRAKLETLNCDKF